MLIFYILLMVIAFWGCEISIKGFKAEECFSRSVTDSVKGIFIWFVFLSHFSSYLHYEAPIDIIGNKISTLLGQLIVACFLFYSGYGIFESIKKKGWLYAKKLPQNRIGKTLFHFILAVLLYLFLQFCLGNTYSLGHIALSLIGWEAVGNSNWYIFVILLLYVLTWLSFLIAKDNIFKAGILATFLTFVMIAFLYLTRWSWWYDTALCYVLGLWISVFKDKFLRLITKNNFAWAISAALSLALFGILYIYNFPFLGRIVSIVKLFTAPAFCLVIVVFLTKIKIANPILIFCGQYLFELYILQRIPMILFKAFGLADWNHYIYFLLCVACTILLALVFRYLTNKIDSYLYKS